MSICKISLRHTACILCFALIFGFSQAGAQVDRAGLVGTVRDQAGRVVPSARILAVLKTTGLQRETLSTIDGTFFFPALPVGSYTLMINADGFEKLTLENVLAVVGHIGTINATLDVAGTAERVDVSAARSELDESSDALGSRIERQQIRELPLNGRNWQTLTALVPGALDSGGSNQRTIRFGGRGLDDNNFTFDGIDATNILNQAQPAYLRLSIPTDSIEEFRVESMLFTAESGSTAGGQVAVTSATGTNDFHGRAFEFLRNDKLDARNPFDQNGKRPFRLNQFGGSFSGPIVRGHTFFYATYEGLRQRLGQTLIGFVPSAIFRDKILAQSPALGAALGAYPVGTSPTVDANINQYTGEGRQLDREDAAMLRVDQRWSKNTTAYVRVSYDRGKLTSPLGTATGFLNDQQRLESAPVNVALELLQIATPKLVNEAKFGFNRGTTRTLNLTPLMYSIRVPGLTTLNGNQLRIGAGNSFSWIDNLTWVYGRHIIKSGLEVRHIQLNQGNSPSGTLNYSSLVNLAANRLNQANVASELPVNGLRKNQYYAFAQDNYQLSPTITLNLGLRYSFFDRFREVRNRAIPFDFATCGPQGYCPKGAEFNRPNRFNFDPRLGLAWAPKSLNDRTIFRIGFGIYHGDGQLDDQNLPIANEVERFSLSGASTPGLGYPLDRFINGTTGILSPRDMDRLRRDMYVTQWGASVQQALPGELVVTLAYVGSKGTHLLTTSYLNVIDPLTGKRPFPNFGQIEFRGNQNNSSYEGLSLTARRSFRKGFLLSANYLWSHEIDDGSLGGGEADFPQNVNCRSCEKASGDFDARHVSSMNGVYELPFGVGKAFLNHAGPLQTVFGNWQISGILSARSGLPVNVTIDRSAATVPDGNSNNQRPDLVAGVSLKPPSGATTGNWINPAAFALPAPGTFGNAGRNLVRAPSVWQLDAGLAKRIVLTEKVRVDFRTEVFNLFNRAQYGKPLANLSAPSTFGRIIQTVNNGPVGTGTPRQLQFMIRVEF